MTGDVGRVELRQLRIFSRWAFGLSWGIGGLALLSGTLSAANPLWHVAAYAISVSGVALTYYFEGWSGILALFARLKPGAWGIAWILLVLAGYGAIAVAAAFLTGQRAALPQGLPAVASGIGWSILTDPGPIGEEFGWRGFALPRLLRLGLPPLRATLILAAFHTLWHLPLFFISTTGQSRQSLAVAAASMVAIAVFDTWMLLRAPGNLLLAVLVHLMANYWGSRFSGHSLTVLIGLQCVCAVAITACGGLRPKPKG